MRALAAVAAIALLGACDPLAGVKAQARHDLKEAPGAPDEDALAPRDIVAFFDCLARENATIVAAHRGGNAPGYAENALATFRHTFAAAPVALEIDVRRTSDGVLVLMHDDSVDRTTDGTGLVSSLSAAQFAALRLRDDDGAQLEEHPPTLAQALEWGAGKTILELDVKRGVPFEDVVAAVRAAQAENRVIVITYNNADALKAHALAPELMISAGVNSEDDVARLRAGGLDLTRVLAWTGTSEPNAALNVALQQAGVETLFGTLGDGPGSWDARFARGEGGGYAAFAETGIELIASDRPMEAQRALDAADGEGYAPLRCVGAS
jgi:glycerophosphoryl diester phosphodiesterase